MTRNISYRADVDGLRAVAVIFVILFHASFDWIGGGFIGVDVFFVISGFLITSSINKELLNDSFSFKSFYLRRIRRIIPVLAVVMLVVTIPACIFLFANDLEAYSRTVLHTILSTNNIHLWMNGRGYFVENTELIPLLHTWSLSVEEQFYFIWPAILVIVNKWFKLKGQLLFIVIFILLGIALSIFLASNYPKLAYFLLPARLFEISLGAGLALFWNRIPELSKKTNNFLSIIGFILILIPAILLNKSSVFPGLNALYPCLGTVMLILSGKNNHKQGFVNRLLGVNVLTGIGLISYSMYLWHWPIFVFIKYLGFNFSINNVVFAIVLTIILSYISWKYIEQPFRYKFKFNFLKTCLIILLPCLLIFGIIYGILDSADGFPNRFSNLAEFNKKLNYPNKVRRNCFDKFRIGNCDECRLGIKKDTLDGVLIGDSFANHTAAFIDVLAKDANLYFHDSAAGGYPLLYDVDPITGKPTRNQSYAIERLSYAKKHKTIIIASNWERFVDSKSKNYKFVLKNIEELYDLGKQIIIVDPLRNTSAINLHKMKMYKVNNIPSIKSQDLLIPFYKRPESYIVYEIIRRFPLIKIINLNDVMCEDNSCDYQIDGSIVYRNGSHLNTSGAELIAKKYLAKKGNPLKFFNKK